MAKKKRTLDGDFRLIVKMLLEASLQGDHEMVNMGDWTAATWSRQTYDKREAIEHLERGGKLGELHPEVMAEAFYEFKLLYRCYTEW